MTPTSPGIQYKALLQTYQEASVRFGNHAQWQGVLQWFIERAAEIAATLTPSVAELPFPSANGIDSVCSILEKTVVGDRIDEITLSAIRYTCKWLRGTLTRHPVRWCMSYVDALRITEAGITEYSMRHPKAWNRMGGMPNGLSVAIAETFATTSTEIPQAVQVRDATVEALRALLKDAPSTNTLEQIGRDDGGARPHPIQTTDLAIIAAHKALAAYTAALDAAGRGEDAGHSDARADFNDDLAHGRDT